MGSSVTHGYLVFKTNKKGDNLHARSLKLEVVAPLPLKSESQLLRRPVVTKSLSVHSLSPNPSTAIINKPASSDNLELLDRAIGPTRDEDVLALPNNHSDSAPVHVLGRENVGRVDEVVHPDALVEGSRGEARARTVEREAVDARGAVGEPGVEERLSRGFEQEDLAVRASDCEFLGIER